VVPCVQVSKVALPNRKDAECSRSQQDNTLRPSRDSRVESALRQDLLDLKMSCGPRFLSLSVDIMHRGRGNFDPQRGLSFPELISHASKAGQMDSSAQLETCRSLPEITH
jgi:hypothetical protein